MELQIYLFCAPVRRVALAKQPRLVRTLVPGNLFRQHVSRPAMDCQVDKRQN